MVRHGATRAWVSSGRCREFDTLDAAGGNGGDGDGDDGGGDDVWCR